MTEAKFPPQHACDCHVHVVGPKSRFPLAPRRSYTPLDAPVETLRAHFKRLGLDRVVIVQPSFYGTDNRCLLAALAELGETARGVAVVDTDIALAETDALHRAGVRGVRLNMASIAGTSENAIATLLRDTADICRRHGWHIQLFAHSQSIVALQGLLPTLGVPVVIDHFGLIDPRDREPSALTALLRLLDSGQVWVKLSAPYRVTDRVDSADLSALAKRLADANPEHAIWGSDWPHTPVHKGTATVDDHETPYRDIDSADLLALVPRWLETTELRQAVMAGNPARLYDF